MIKMIEMIEMILDDHQDDRNDRTRWSTWCKTMIKVIKMIVLKLSKSTPRWLNRVTDDCQVLGTKRLQVYQWTLWSSLRHGESSFGCLRARQTKETKSAIITEEKQRPAARGNGHSLFIDQSAAWQQWRHRDERTLQPSEKRLLLFKNGVKQTTAQVHRVKPQHGKPTTRSAAHSSPSTSSSAVPNFWLRF